MAALRTRVRASPLWEHAGAWLVGGVMALMSFGAVLLTADLPGQLLAAATGVVAFGWMYLTTRGGRLVVGADGFSVSGIAGLPAFVSWADVESVRPATQVFVGDPAIVPRGIEVRLHSGKKLYLPRVPRREHVAREMNVRLNTYRGREPGPTTLPARGDRSFAAWVAELERAASTSDYRSQPLTPAQLVSVAEDIGAPTDARAAAAVVACRVGSKNDTTRIRVAAEEAAEPQLADAMRRATRGKLAEL